MFDADDTLWPTQIYYDRAKDRFIKLLSRLGIEDTSARDKVDQVDAARVAVHGFSRKRFPGSLVEALSHYGDLCGLQVNSRARRVAAKIGTDVFRAPTRVNPRTRAVLRSLSLRYELVLVTKGDKRIQRSRLKHSKLEKYFASVHIVETKSTEVLEGIMRTHGASATKTLFVGDSLRSDIYPALRLGAFAAWIPAPSWHYEHARTPRSVRLIRLHSVADLLELSRKN